MNTEKSLQFFLYYDEKRVEKAHQGSKNVPQLLRDLRTDKEETLARYTNKIDTSVETRAYEKLVANLQTLTSLVHTANETAKKTNSIPIVLCGEDFFQGGDIATDKEIVNNTGTCIPRNMAFEFFATQLRELSKKYPEVIILPGSAYLSVSALATDNAVYKQDNQSSIKPSIYVQNVLPVFYNGEWVKLIKKGSPLVVEKTGEAILTEDAFSKACSIKQRIVVNDYGEDNLTDINRNLVVFGETPLPNEEVLLRELNIVNNQNRDSFFSPIFELNNLTFGVEICRDHDKKKLLVNYPEADKYTQIHAISSLGIGWKYNAAETNNGYRVQADADSLNSISVAINKGQPYELIPSGNILISAPLPYPSISKKSTFESVESKESSQLKHDKQPTTHATSYSFSFFKSHKGSSTMENAIQKPKENSEDSTLTSSPEELNGPH